ncbi:MAG: XRE family transcriptional regulator [Gammaproteobacteria bacterium]|nr:XRE family transcriptional regulator [Gammaproteobacteria bacterium]
MSARANHVIAASSEIVLTKALLRLAKAYGLSQKELAQILGESESSMSRLYAGQRQIDPASKVGELTVLLIRLYRSLNALIGDEVKAPLWLRANNHYFGEPPIEHIKHVEGLVQVVRYLDAMRGQG